MKTLAPILMLTLVLSGCASKELKNEINEKAQQSNVTGPDKLGKTIQETIQSSEFLTKEQKAELEQIIAQNKKKAEELSAQSFQFRSVLIQELLVEKADKKKIRLLKKNIKEVEDEKLKNTFETIEKISSVVSKNKDRKNFGNPLLYIDRSFR